VPAEIKKILISISFSSEYSKDHFSYAAHLAKKMGAELIALSVLNQGDIDSAAVYSRLVGAETIKVNDLANMEIERRKKRIEVVLNEIGLADIERTVIMKVGDPFEEILKAIDEFDVDIVVVGTSGTLTKDERFNVLRGSVTEKVFKHSPVPVLSIRTVEPKAGKKS
jgi:nucleotide-binding universal stress UspA family protein